MREHEEWAELVERDVDDLLRGVPDAERYTVIGRTEVADALVRTVWLKTNTDDGPSITFRTTIYGGPLAEMTWRYATEAEARAGHVAAVAVAESAGLSAGATSRDVAEEEA